MSKPWLQQPDESAKAYKAFEAYLEDRDNTQLDAYLGYIEWRYDDEGTQSEKARKAKARGRAPGHISRWASEHDWERRRKAYYAQIDEQAYDALMESKKRRKVERIELLDEAFEALEGNVGEALSTLLDSDDVDVQNLTLLIDKLLRQYRQELDDLPTQQHDVADADELAAMLGVSLDDADGD